MVGRERDRHLTGRYQHVVWDEYTMQCTITNVGSAPWAYAQLGVRKTFQCNCGARNACVFGVHSRLRSSSTRQKAQGIPPQVTARPTQPGARQREGPRVTLTGVVETAEAERLEMYLRSVRNMPPNSFLASVVGRVDVCC